MKILHVIDNNEPMGDCEEWFIILLVTMQLVHAKCFNLRAYLVDIYFVS